jgi:hypothetical protein
MKNKIIGCLEHDKTILDQEHMGSHPKDQQTNGDESEDVDNQAERVVARTEWGICH